MRLSATGIECDGRGTPAAMVAFADSVLRGVGQVMLQNNAWTGLIFIIGVAVSSPLFTAALIAGTAVSTAAALLFDADRALIRSGMFGFNGGLAGIALLYFLRPDPLTWACLVLAAAGATVLTAALADLLARWRLPALTMPFVLASLCVFLATARFGRLAATGELPAAGLPAAAMVEGTVGAATVANGLANGLAQVFFQMNPLTGLLFVAALAVASRRAAVMAVGGALIGLLVAWLMGAAEPALRGGAYGFNNVLIAIALGATFSRPGWRPLALVLLALLSGPFVVAATAALLQPFGLPGLTLPFVTVTWAFLLASDALARRDEAASRDLPG